MLLIKRLDIKLFNIIYNMLFTVTKDYRFWNNTTTVLNICFVPDRREVFVLVRNKCKKIGVVDYVKDCIYGTEVFRKHLLFLSEFSLKWYV